MLHTGHRLSKDIDAFIDDPQYLGSLSPEKGAEGIWGCDAFTQAANHLKLVYSEGEIDFIVAPAITDLPVERKSIDPDETTPRAAPFSYSRFRGGLAAVDPFNEPARAAAGAEARR